MEEKAKYFEECQDTKKIVERQDVGFNLLKPNGTYIMKWKLCTSLQIALSNRV
jgi:hypothetical protein